MTNEEVLRIYEKTGGLLKGHFLLASGRHSDTYMQSAKLFVDPLESEKICAALAAKLKKYKAELIVSPAVGGLLMGYELARQLGIKNIFAEKCEGGFELRRGFELSCARVIIAEDVVTTGGSVRDVVELIKKLGGEVAAVACIVDRSNGKTDFGVPFEALLRMEVISYDAADCPLCKQGIPVYKPGSGKK